MKNVQILAFDLGATSGRGLLGKLNNGILTTEELYRFPTPLVEMQGKLYWDIYAIFHHIKDTLRLCSEKRIEIDSLGIDSWGVDFVYLAPDGSIISLPRAYRDPYTKDIPKEFFEHFSQEIVYSITGIQEMNFNSLFQLFAAQKEGCFARAHFDKILFIPDLLSYLLTKRQVCEYTIASTSQLLDARKKEISVKLCDALCLKSGAFPAMVMPGDFIGLLDSAIACELNIKQIPVYAVAGHDTASAVAAIPTIDESFAFLSSGTWSLMGIEVKEPIISEESFRLNFTNEGGVDGSIRFLKNITGMWILEECLKSWRRQGKKYSYEQVIQMAQDAFPFKTMIDPDNDLFVRPSNMIQAIEEYCTITYQLFPDNDASIIRCILESLVFKCRYVLETLKEIAPFPIKRLHLIGGGTKNRLLCQFLANAIDLPLVAGPVEATAIGNIMTQARALGVVSNLQEMRQIIKNSFPIETYYPEDTPIWQAAYNQFVKYTGL